MIIEIKGIYLKFMVADRVSLCISNTLLIYFIITIHSLKSINTISKHEQRRIPS